MASGGAGGSGGYRAPRRAVARLAGRPLDTLDGLGDQLSFYGRTFGWTYRTVLRYKREVVRLVAEVSLGSGALAVIGGTLVVTAFLTFFTGSEVALQGYSGLQQVGAESFIGLITAYFNTRDIAPLTAAIGLSATIGSGFTAQLGAMRVNEEIDALEAMAVPPLPFLVTARVLAGLVAIVPLYVVSLLSSYLGSYLIVTLFYGASGGTYLHFFDLFLPPFDVLWSFGKVLVFAVIVMLVHCYYGYTVSGGPVEVGVAVGRAVRTTFAVVAIADFFLTLGIFGGVTTIRIAG